MSTAYDMRVHVICFGNLWCGDDGFGIHVHRALLDRLAARPGIALFDAGVSGLAALAHFTGCAKAVVVDAVRDGGPPGRVVRWIQQPDPAAPPDPAFSAHDVSLATLLAALDRVLDAPVPEVVVVGATIVPRRAAGDTLTPSIAAAVATAVALVEAECTS
jgi:hydrogenase maturation protease